MELYASLAGFYRFQCSSEGYMKALSAYEKFMLTWLATGLFIAGAFVGSWSRHKDDQVNQARDEFLLQQLDDSLCQMKISGIGPFARDKVQVHTEDK